jgi:uncharacterized protein YecE (DUF72 family)
MSEELPANLLVGTSSWSSKDWCGTFYPESIEPGQMISVYAQKYRTVEIDSTWHYMPNRTMVDAWRDRTPQGFIFSAKVPRVISHDKYLEDCEEDLNQFLRIMEGLGDKLGPLVLQFQYVAKAKDAAEYATGDDFLARLKKFLPLLSRQFQWGIEIRNPRWVRAELLDLLHAHAVSLVFIDYYTMDPLHKMAQRPEVFTAPFVYLRFLGHHKEMDELVRKAREEGKRKSDWESLIVDRSREMRQWIPTIREVVVRGIPTYVYFNNHYAGYAPGSVELFLKSYLSGEQS